MAEIPITVIQPVAVEKFVPTPEPPAEVTQHSALGNWVQEKLQYFSQCDSGIVEALTALPALQHASPYKEPGALLSEMVGFFAAAEHLNLKASEYSEAHALALADDVKNKKLYSKEGLTLYAKGILASHPAVAEGLTKHPIIASSHLALDGNHLLTGARLAAELFDLGKQPYEEVRVKAKRSRI